MGGSTVNEGDRYAACTYNTFLQSQNKRRRTLEVIHLCKSSRDTWSGLYKLLQDSSGSSFLIFKLLTVLCNVSLRRQVFTVVYVEITVLWGVTTYSFLGTNSSTLKIEAEFSTKLLVFTSVLLSWRWRLLVHEPTLKEIADFSKKLIPIQQNIWHHIPEDGDLNVILVRNIIKQV